VITVSSFVGRRVPPATVLVRRERLRVPLLLLLLWWLVKKLTKVVVVIVRSPVAMITLAIVTLTVSGWRWLGPWLVTPCYLAVITGLAVLRVRLPVVFEQRVYLVLRSRWRRWSIYRYKWPATMNFADLDRVGSNGIQYQPVLLSVRCTRDLDLVRARMLAGQVVEDWGKVSDRLCQTFGAQDCRVRSVPGRPHEIEAWFLVRDPLQHVVLAARAGGAGPLGRPAGRHP